MLFLLSGEIFSLKLNFKMDDQIISNWTLYITNIDSSSPVSVSMESSYPKKVDKSKVTVDVKFNFNVFRGIKTFCTIVYIFAYVSFLSL